MIAGKHRYGRRMQLRHGVTVGQAIDALRQRIADSQRAYGLNYSDAEMKRQECLNWVNVTQVQLRTVFADNELEDAVLARGYWHFCQMPSDSAARLLSRLIEEELVFQAGHPGTPGDSGGQLGEAVTRLAALARLMDRPGRTCIMDPNALLHYTRFDQLRWTERLGGECLRLVIPLAVVDEL